MKIVSKFLMISYAILMLLFIFRISLSFFDYSYLGYYSDKYIYWLWLGFTGIIIVWFWKNKAIKIYFFSLITLIILSILPMTIPFFGMVYSFSTIDDFQQIKLNEKYRIELTKHQALSMQRIYVFEKKGYLEKNISRPIYSHIIEKTLALDSNEYLDLNKFVIENARFVSANKDSIAIEYKIAGKKKIIYHKINSEQGY